MTEEQYLDEQDRLESIEEKGRNYGKDSKLPKVLHRLFVVFCAVVLVNACIDNTAPATTPAKTIHNPIKVFNYDTNQKEIISRNSIDSFDVVCIARISVLRDVLIDILNSRYDTSDLLTNATNVQDDLFMKYPHSIPTSWIDQEKLNFRASLGGNLQDTSWLESQYKPCGVSI